jgi:hypothetical protein
MAFVSWDVVDSQAERLKRRTAPWWELREAAEAAIDAASYDQRREANWRLGARRVQPDMPDSMLRLLASERARLMGEWLASLQQVDDAAGTMVRLNRATKPLGAKPFPACPINTTGEDLRAAMERVRCPMWWRRQLRREVVRLREVQAIAGGEVCRRRRQVYVTDDTVARKAERNAANAAMLEATEIEAGDGEIITLAQAVAASTSNKAIRRGELMTRIRGCEEWADAAGMVGLFTTNTAPSRFHPRDFKTGEANPNHEGWRLLHSRDRATPRDGQEWLRTTWQRTRAKLQRAGVRFFGFRVAEPHHDGCPHWHMLLWVEPAHLQALRDTMRRYWLKDAGDEAGAQEHRFKAVDIDKAKGGAIAYVSKYIAKNIDDVGALEAEGHRDEHAGEQGELFGATARRVEAWASAWGIRQFQPIGQPPVTVWRELRRLLPESVAGASDAIKAAHAAVHRKGDRRADWRAYMAAQGGAMVGRSYRVRIVADAEQREGRYGPAEVLRPLGVEDAMRPGEWVLSDRREWKPRGSWSEDERGARTANPLREVVRGSAPQAPCPPRTRFNNCTQSRAPLMTWQQRAALETGAGGLQPEKEPPPWTRSAPPRPSLTTLRSCFTKAS